MRWFLTMSFLCDISLIIMDLGFLLYVYYLSVYLDCKLLKGRYFISSFLKNVHLLPNTYDALHTVLSYFWWGKCGPGSNSVSVKSKWCWVDISQYIYHLLLRGDYLFCTEQRRNSVPRAESKTTVSTYTS